MWPSLAYFLSVSLISRLILSGDESLSAATLLPALYSDLAVSVLLAVAVSLASRVAHWLLYPLLLLYYLYQAANVEMVLALDKPLLLTELQFGLDLSFIANSVQHPASPLYLLVSGLLTAALFVWHARSAPASAPKHAPKHAVLATAAAIVLLTQTWSTDWRSNNSFAIATVQLYQQLAIRELPLEAGLEIPGLERVDQLLLPSRLTPRPGRPNVLLVVLEGVSGAYLPTVADFYGLQTEARMPRLDSIVQQGMNLPNYVAHGHQTIRGLYAMLCGDYSKLSVEAFKSAEYLALAADRRQPCLPELLAEAGYATVYAQAAELSYMGKDRFMPAAGFQQVLGKDDFPLSYVESSWGPDDKAFLEQSVALLSSLQAEQSPWFLTLLTVGTHHPYAIPNRTGMNVTAQRLAAIEYLDRAVAEFWSTLLGQGLLDDTLVIFTSDESHGVAGQPLTRNWGLFAALGPGVIPQSNLEVRGQIDLPVTVLDYLSLPSVAQASGYSAFRQNS
jgi:hypothetical protein